jgi:hypothetical protein
MSDWLNDFKSQTEQQSVQRRENLKKITSSRALTSVGAGVATFLMLSQVQPTFVLDDETQSEVSVGKVVSVSIMTSLAALIGPKIAEQLM